MGTTKVKDLPDQDRPREKLLLRGVKSLSDAELLAILIRTGKKGKSVIEIAREMVLKHDGLINIARLSPSALQAEEGIGKDKAATLAASFEISRRVNDSFSKSKNPKITSPDDIAKIFIPILRDEVKEQFIVICLSTANRVIKYEVISVGNLNTSIVHPREVFKVAIDNNSANIILLHNHPSGNIEPSKEDINITKQLVEAGNIMGIQVFDHIIVAGDKYTSFVDRKIL